MKEYLLHDTLGQYLCNLRTCAGLSQTELASKIRPTHKNGNKFVSRMEKDEQTPTAEELVKIAEAVGCDKDMLLEASHYFAQGNSADDKIDLRPLLTKLGQAADLVTPQHLAVAIKHFVALSKVGGV